MVKDMKFTVILTRKYYEKEELKPVYPIIEYEPSKEIGMGDIPIYGKKAEDYEDVMVSHSGRELAMYEQIPLTVGGISLSVIQTSYDVYSYEEGADICEKVASYGEFCSLDKLNQAVLAANFYHSASPYVISFGYEYTNESGKKVDREFKTQEERNKSAFEETGYEFEKLDWIDRLNPKKENSDSPKQAKKK